MGYTVTPSLYRESRKRVHTHSPLVKNTRTRTYVSLSRTLRVTTDNAVPIASGTATAGYTSGVTATCNRAETYPPDDLTPPWRTVTPSRDARVAELCIRHHLGMYRDRPAVDRRLAELFQTNPPDVLDRLERAADHLGVTGDDLERLADMATARLADAPAGRQGDMPDGLITGPIKRSEGSDS